MRLRNHDVLLRMLHRFDLLVPSRASGQRHVVPCFGWSRWGGDEGVDEGGNENWIPSPTEDSRKKDQPLNKGTMKNPRRKNLFFAAPTARHLQISCRATEQPASKIATENGWLEYNGFLLERLGLFSGANLLVSFRECKHLKGHV